METRYLSLFSGIEAASQAWCDLGWECAAVSEIEPFPCSLLERYYPSVPNLGDVEKITEEQIRNLGRIDLVVGGFPCQDLSVAGRREGLHDVGGNITRSGLFFAGLRVFQWARKHCGARYLLLENVPGMLSNKKGRDFAAVVGHLAGLENVPVPAHGWGTEGVAVGPNGMLEWCVLDAQWFGLAQRRKRVFVVLDTGDWASRQPILLESEGLRGDSPPSREAGSPVAALTANGVGTCGADDTQAQAGHLLAPTLTARPSGGGGLGTDFDLDGGLVGCWWDGGQVSQTLDAVLYKGQTMPEKNRFPAVLQPLVAHTLRGEGFDASEDGTGRGTPIVPIAFPEKMSGTQCAAAVNVSPSIGAINPTAVAFAQGLAVRRITPMECERLQGFPDNYTLVNHRGKQAKDTPRYKSLGNSMAVTCMRWIGHRLAAVMNG